MEKTVILPRDFDLVLRPNMSLSRRGFFWLMVFFSADIADCRRLFLVARRLACFRFFRA
jgi:uncharacterized membrane protein